MDCQNLPVSKFSTQVTYRGRGRQTTIEVGDNLKCELTQRLASHLYLTWRTIVFSHRITVCLLRASKIGCKYLFESCREREAYPRKDEWETNDRRFDAIFRLVTRGELDASGLQCDSRGNAVHDQRPLQQLPSYRSIIDNVQPRYRT